MKRNDKILLFIVIGIAVMFFIAKIVSGWNKLHNEIDYNWHYKDGALKIISSSENEDLEEIIKNYAKTKGYDVDIEYAGTLDIMSKLNNGEEYDAVWLSNSIWMYMLDKNVSTSNSKCTSINPVVFGITKSKAQELGFIENTVYTKDIVCRIQQAQIVAHQHI